jgi:MFS family permease
MSASSWRRLNPWRGLGGLPRDVWVIALVTFVNRAGTMVLPFLAVYTTQDRGLGPRQAGFIVTAFGLGSLSASLIAGRMADKIGALPVLRVSLFTGGAVLLALAYVSGFPALLACTFAWALASEGVRPAGFAAISHLVPPAKQKPAFTLYRLAVNAGMTFGPVAGGLLAARAFELLFWVDAVTSFLAGTLLVVARLKMQPWSREHAAAGGPSPLRDPRLVFFLLALVPILLVFFQHTSTMPLHLVRNLGLTTSMVGLLMAVNTVLILLFEVPLSAATATWPPARALPLGAAFAAAGFGAMAVAPSALAVAATVVLWSFGEMILFPSSSTYVAATSAPARRGAAMGMYTMSFRFAATLAPWLGTQVLDRFGATTLWIGAGAVGFLSVLLLSRVRR